MILDPTSIKQQLWSSNTYYNSVSIASLTRLRLRSSFSLNLMNFLLLRAQDEQYAACFERPAPNLVVKKALTSSTMLRPSWMAFAKIGVREAVVLLSVDLITASKTLICSYYLISLGSHDEKPLCIFTWRAFTSRGAL